jgi:electron transport complex protein RnfD
MATDYVTSPVTNLGKTIYGIGIGALTVIIRNFGIYPEGVSFAILSMNVVTPFLDQLKPRIFGTGVKK